MGLTKIDRFMYDMAKMIGKWRNEPLGRDTESYYNKIVKYVGNHLISEFVNDLRYLRHLGLPDKTYDAYIKLDNKWEEKLNE